MERRSRARTDVDYARAKEVNRGVGTVVCGKCGVERSPALVNTVQCVSILSWACLGPSMEIECVCLMSTPAGNRQGAPNGTGARRGHPPPSTKFLPSRWTQTARRLVATEPCRGNGINDMPNPKICLSATRERERKNRELQT